MIAPIDIEARQLIAAIFPTPGEARLDRLMQACWRCSETGVYGWLGCQVDDLLRASQRRRARLGRHRAGVPK